MSEVAGFDWMDAVHEAIGEAEIELLAGESDAATFRVMRSDGEPSVLKAVRQSDRKLESMRFQWNALSLFRKDIDFPGPRPLARHKVGDGIEAIEISYLPGRHPEFESDEDFRTFGETIARLHALSSAKTIAGAPVWDLRRIAPHFEDARLRRLMSDEERRIATFALERFGQSFQAQIDAAIWTGLVHSDSHRHNVVIDRGRGSLIDFGECGFGPLFWDLGVAVADSAIDAPERGDACRSNLIAGYTSVLPQAENAVHEHLHVFEAMRSLEVMTWPVSDWSPERLNEDEDEAIENIELSSRYLETLLQAN